MKLTKEENLMFIELARSSFGPNLCRYIDKLILELVDIRNIKGDNTDIERKAREVAVNVLETEFKSRLQILSKRGTNVITEEYI